MNVAFILKEFSQLWRWQPQFLLILRVQKMEMKACSHPKGVNKIEKPHVKIRFPEQWKRKHALQHMLGGNIKHYNNFGRWPFSFL